MTGNFNPSLLDLFFTKNIIDVRSFGHSPAVGISNHSAVYAIFDTFTTRRVKNTYQIRNLNNIDVNNASTIANEIDWSEIYATNDVDEMMDVFYSMMYNLQDKICPLKTVVSKHEPFPWMNKNIKEHMDKRKMFYDWWKLNRKHQSGEMMYSAYHKLDVKTKNLIEENKRNNFVTSYKKADSSQARWNLIHKFGITRKSRKQTNKNKYR